MSGQKVYVLILSSPGDEEVAGVFTSRMLAEAYRDANTKEWWQHTTWFIMEHIVDEPTDGAVNG